MKSKGSNITKEEKWGDYKLAETRYQWTKN